MRTRSLLCAWDAGDMGLTSLRLMGELSTGAGMCRNDLFYHICCSPSVQVVDAAGLWEETAPGGTCSGNILSPWQVGTSNWLSQLLLPPG